MNKRLNFLDQYLTWWIFLAMILGVSIGYLYPNIEKHLEALTIGSTNIPLAIGLMLMMYPPLAKVDYSSIPKLLLDKKVLTLSILLNWIVGPSMMFLLAVLFLSNIPHYMVGLILIGLARCIAMVLVWNELADGNKEYGAMLVALNSIFQIISYGAYTWLFINILPRTIGLGEFHVHISIYEVAKSILIYLGIPFLAGYISHKALIRRRGKDWYQKAFLPKISPITLYALLFTVILMFSSKGNQIIALPFEVLRIAIPLILYFVIMFFVSFLLGRYLNIPYEINTPVSFTATGNNFELAIAISISVFGINSPEAFVGVIGPLIEVPVLIFLVRVSSQLKKHLYN